MKKNTKNNGIINIAIALAVFIPVTLSTVYIGMKQEAIISNTMSNSEDTISHSANDLVATSDLLNDAEAYLEAMNANQETIDANQ